jgi:hypothetical protein
MILVSKFLAPTQYVNGNAGRARLTAARRHPRQLTRLGEDLVARLHAQLEHWQHAADDFWLQRFPQ